MTSRGKMLVSMAMANLTNNNDDKIISNNTCVINNNTQNENAANNMQQTGNNENKSTIINNYQVNNDGTLVELSENECIFLLPVDQDLIEPRSELQNNTQLEFQIPETNKINMEIDDFVSHPQINEQEYYVNELSTIAVDNNAQEMELNDADDNIRGAKDTEYIVSENNSIISSDEAETNNRQKTKSRRGKANREEWKRNKQKTLRRLGKSYLSRIKKVGKSNEKLIGERKIGPRCNSQYCLKSGKRFCNDIPETLRQEVFKHFWSNLSWDGRKSYIASLVDCKKPKQKRRAESGDRRGNTFHYFIKINTERREVCREMFCNTFALGVWSVKNWAKCVLHGMKRKSTEDISSQENETEESEAQDESDQIDNANKEVRVQEKSTEVKDGRYKRRNFAVSFIEMLPKMESHYCRKDTNKLYLEETFQSLMDLYRVYKQRCVAENEQILSRFTFTEIVNELNVSIFQPKKDQCDICCKYKVGNLSEDDYTVHRRNIERAREEKNNDKMEAIEKTCKVFSVDMQAVKLAPFLKASALYYKTKLCCHNYTIYELDSHDVDCYWWNEAEGELKGQIFASILINHMIQIIDNWPEAYPRVIKIWSDGCVYQNKNQILSNALLELSMKNNFTIHQKYLQVGHTQMEVDSVHAAIERRLKNREIHLPSDYIAASKEARVQAEGNGSRCNKKSSYPPYRAHYLTYDFFKDYCQPNGQRYTSVRPGNKATDPTVNDVCHYVYLSSGTIQYKLNFDDELKSLPRRAKIVNPGIIYPQLYNSRLKLATTKWDHLQQLKAVLPQAVHYFYDTLPH